MTAINLSLASRPQIRDMLKAGTITPEAALARCDEIIARESTSANKRQGWTTLRSQIVAGTPVNVAATYAHLKPAAKPAKAKPEPKPADAPKAKRNTAGIDAASLARAANLLADKPELMAAFMQLMTKR